MFPKKKSKILLPEKKDLNKDVATRLALYFHTAPTFWVNLQSNYNEEQVENLLYKNLKKEVHPLTQPKETNSRLRKHA